MTPRRSRDRARAIAAIAIGVAGAAGAIGQPVRAAPASGFRYAPERPSNARCSLVVNGRTYIDGACLVTPSGGGSFGFNDNRTEAFCRHRARDCAMAELTVTRRGYFGALDVRAPGVGDAYWNEGEGLHAQTRLGTLHRKGACWISATAARPRVKLCAWAA